MEMSSIVRNSTVARSLPAAAQFVPNVFTNSDGYDQPFPWRYNKATEAIDLEFVDGFTASTQINDNDVFFRGQNLSGIKLVRSLGPNFITWCETNVSINADASTVELYEAPIVVSANMIAPDMSPNNGGSGTSPDPISFENAAGTVAGKYNKTLIFMKPMVITYKVNGTREYRWFNQNFEGNT